MRKLRRRRNGELLCPILAEQQGNSGKCRHNHQHDDERVDGIGGSAVDPRIVLTVTHGPLTDHADVTRECQSIGGPGGCLGVIELGRSVHHRQRERRTRVAMMRIIISRNTRPLDNDLLLPRVIGGRGS